MGLADLAVCGDCRNHAAMRVATLAALLAAAVLASQASAASVRSMHAFSGAGTWISIYDTHALNHPERVVARLKAHRIHTLFLETSNDRQRRGVKRPVAVARFLDAAHRAHIKVVGWYVPGFYAPVADIHRALQGARFHSPSGQGFDAFALDIESTKVRDLGVRTARALRVARAVRVGMAHGKALGAVTIDPAGGRYWNGYPFARLARSVQVFLPMEYFTYRTSGPRHVAAYSRANVRLVRRLAADRTVPVHPIGGDAGDASMPELRAFLHASKNELGVSLWEYGNTTTGQLRALAAIRR
jgi:hypothetical protein